ncbi:MAG TPA: hypothetical protein VHM65_10085 [Candidatus Lustribacter sp.]|nr:hypothetical protein [Candidatus Lustribacter sp.]
MTSPGSGATRLLRSGVVAASTVALASAAHAQGGGTLPSGPGLAVLTVLTACVVGVGTGRRLGVPAIGAMLGLGQVCLHLALGALGSGAATTAHAMVHGRAVAHLPAAHLAHTTHSSGRMLLTHALATALTAILLAFGERTLWALWERVRPRPAVATTRLRLGVARRALGPGEVCRPATPSFRWPPLRGPPPVTV